jgi:ankyrin repeat protein
MDEKAAPFHLASPHLDPTIAQSLIQYGANMNVRDDGGSTALSLALYNDNFEVIKLLIHRGADVNTVQYSKQPGAVRAIASRGAPRESRDWRFTGGE